MILTGLFTWFMSLFDIVDPIVIPNVTELMNYFNYAVDLVCDGVSLLGLFIGDTGLFAISFYLVYVFALEMFYLTYQLIWFVLKKLPMLNVRP